MAKTIAELTAKGTIADSDNFVVHDGAATKKIAASVIKSDCLKTATADGVNVALGTTTGTQIGTGAAQKLAFYGATPVVQPAVTADLLDSLQALGLVASSAGNTPLNLTKGAVACGTLSCDTITLSDGSNIAANETTGTKIGTAATQKLAFWNATPAAQPATVADAATQSLTGTDLINRAKVEADLTSCKNAINAVIDRLQALGLIASA